MADYRIENLAKLLVRYSLRLKKGEWIEIIGPYIAEELLLACQVEALKAGAHVSLRVLLPDSTYLFYRHAGPEQLRFISPMEKVATERRDAMLFIWGGWNTKELTAIDPKRMAAVQASRRPLFETRLKREAEGKFRWVGTMFPTDSSAQDAEMSRSEYQDFVYGAGMVGRPDAIARWQAVSRQQAKLVRFLNRLSSIRIVGEDTDITFRTKGRKWVNCDGHVNFPDGEVFTSPDETSTEGRIRYTFPAVYGGKEVHNVRLTFRRGRVVEAKADKNEDLLRAMLKSDDGASRVGELAFGTNYSIKRFTKNTLFDEKIGGTMHVAVGAALPEAGGKNKSGVHWDMVCDTRKDFVVYGDGRPVFRNGRFLRK
ncbi:aminopeptidase [candidate division WOR-3 bacterium]|nr:aminopeptidase [candidate division WOR-3 bacterium]